MTQVYGYDLNTEKVDPRLVEHLKEVGEDQPHAPVTILCYTNTKLEKGENRLHFFGQFVQGRARELRDVKELLLNLGVDDLSIRVEAISSSVRTRLNLERLACLSHHPRVRMIRWMIGGE